jgi:ADP-ribose pyrophosphatase
MTDLHASRLASRLRFEGRVFSVYTDRVRLPNGYESDLDVVRHPGSVVLVPLADKDHVILVRQYRYSIDRWIWELPAGRIEPGESVETAVRRECEEEIGLVPGRLEAIGALYPSPGFCDEIMRFYRVSGLSLPPAGSKVQHDADEDLTVRTFGLEDVRRMVREGEIVDLKTGFALQLV